MCQTQREVASLLLWSHTVSSLPWLHTINFVYFDFFTLFFQIFFYKTTDITDVLWSLWMSIGKVIYNESLMFPDKELLSSKERLELEVTSLRTSLQEQQSKMDILDNALTNAQGNVVRLEEEVRTSNSWCSYLFWWFSHCISKDFLMKLFSMLLMINLELFPLFLKYLIFFSVL